MFKVLYPYEYADSVFAIDYHALLSKGYKGIIFDIDNTLAHHGEDPTEEVDNLFVELHNLGLKTLLLSNNCKERILSFMRNIDTLYIDEADKPNVASYYKALDILGLSKDEVVFVGDQVFTDIYGANKCGIPSILVKYMRYDSETKIGIRRRLEKVILWFYGFSRRYQHRLGSICKKEASN
ncbi:HAD superfamily phosphatase (TIGR01668 family) [Lachnospiraceae bacterium PF1-21]|uniref:HAD-IIIA family hydrolase n=1 Tax=Ohessyouella blattaphilus TaxID=2949333 RepID=A0ABT1EGH4_9FIRM|nr:HAD-IIIA family hydrolase [Ohessyouella blattaphilus]MCP1109815.1 HAD-IIIA family hydrolase [Ohessyouella blattaphilus]MCR8563209.1 HAD-IIIA family hydrolase [Ohessyouella blattaphilus]